jgi:hypothetical protein
LVAYVELVEEVGEPIGPGGFVNILRRVSDAESRLPCRRYGEVGVSEEAKGRIASKLIDAGFGS